MLFSMFRLQNQRRLYKVKHRVMFLIFHQQIVYMKNLQAPVKKGDIVGEAQYLLDGKVIGKTDIVAGKSVKKAGLWDYIKHIRKRMIKGDDYLADR